MCFIKYRMNKMKLEAQQKKICIYNYELKHSFSISKLKKNSNRKQDF